MLRLHVAFPYVSRIPVNPKFHIVHTPPPSSTYACRLINPVLYLCDRRNLSRPLGPLPAPLPPVQRNPRCPTRQRTERRGRRVFLALVGAGYDGACVSAVFEGGFLSPLTHSSICATHLQTTCSVDWSSASFPSYSMTFLCFVYRRNT